MAPAIAKPQNTPHPTAAVMSGTQGHTTPAAFGIVMEITKPRMAVASHFQNDFDTAALVKEEIRSQYQGPLSLATDFMVWNITRDKLTTRMAVANPESFPPPAQVSALPGGLMEDSSPSPRNTHRP